MESPWIKDVSDDDFDQEVLARSRELPVVVDFWAEWCGPCRTLGPVLEREVDALGGRVLLAKVDTESARRVASELRIRSIPAVMAFRDGQVVDEFVGALPASQVRAFLARLAPSEARQTLDRAVAARDAGDGATAKKIAGELLSGAAAGAAEPAIIDQAALLLAGVLLDEGRIAEVEPALARVDARGPLADKAETLRQLVALAEEARAYGGEDQARAALAANDGDLEARYALAAALATSGRADGAAQALELLLEIVGRSRRFKGDGALRAMRLIFEALGADADLTREFRRRLQIVT